MNKARTSHTVGLAGGVLSLAGLCVGIFLGKKGGRTTLGPRFVEPLPEPVQPFVKVLDELEREQELADVYQTQQVESPVLGGTEVHDTQQSGSLDRSVTEGLTPAERNPELRTLQEVISDLAHKGESALAIAQVLGVSVGEVQLTLKLQQFSAFAGRRS